MFVLICLITIDNLLAMSTKTIRVNVYIHIYKVLAGFDLSLQLDNVITSDILATFIINIAREKWCTLTSPFACRFFCL